MVAGRTSCFDHEGDLANYLHETVATVPVGTAWQLSKMFVTRNWQALPFRGRPMATRVTAGTTPVAKDPRRALAHLPGEESWPIVGNTFAALKNPVGHAEGMYRKYGAV